MTRILVQRGSGSSSNQTRAGSPSATQPESLVTTAPQDSPASRDEETSDDMREEIILTECMEYCGIPDNKMGKIDDLPMESITSDRSESLNDEVDDKETMVDEVGSSGDLTKGLGGPRLLETSAVESESFSADCPEVGGGTPQPPPPPVPPPKPLVVNSNLRRSTSGSSNSVRIGSSRRAGTWPVVSTRTSPSGSRPSSPRSLGESEGYNSSDELNPPFVSSYDDFERERQFEIEIRRSKGLEVKRMLEDGNCLFRAVADQVYGDSETYDVVRQMCIDYMERERDHFSQFITEGFTSYCKRKRRDKVYGNNVEIQAMSEIYNRPIHIYSYTTEPMNIFHGSYNTDSPPIRLSYHHGNHYNSLVDPRRLTIGAGLGFSCLRVRNVDKDQVKAAIKAQQDQQIDNALLAEGQFYSDLELTEKEIEHMVMVASRAEYLAIDRLKQRVSHKGYSTSGAEPSSSGMRSLGSETKVEAIRDHCLQDTVLDSSVRMVLSMGFSYLQAIEAYNLFGDDVDSMVCYLLETSSGGRHKGKAAE